VVKSKKRKVPEALAPPEHPWERQTHQREPDAAFGGFVTYRDMGADHRSLAKVAAKLGKSTALAERWSHVWDWVVRVRAYDAWLDRETKRAEIGEVLEMRRRHIQLAMSFQGAAALALNKIIKAEKNGEQLTLKPSEVKELAELGVKIERLNRELPSDVTEQRVEQTTTVAHDYSGLSLEELLQLEKLISKTKKGA